MSEKYLDAEAGGVYCLCMSRSTAITAPAFDGSRAILSALAFGLGLALLLLREFSLLS